MQIDNFPPDGPLKFDQDVNIAVGRLFTSHPRTEYPDPLNPEAFSCVIRLCPQYPLNFCEAF
jgi:hypothetical protein